MKRCRIKNSLQQTLASYRSQIYVKFRPNLGSIKKKCAYSNEIFFFSDEKVSNEGFLVAKTGLLLRLGYTTITEMEQSPSVAPEKENKIRKIDLVCDQNPVLVSGTETKVKFWYRSRNFYCRNFFSHFSNLFSIFPPLFNFLREYEFFVLKSLNLNTDLQKQFKNLQYLAGNLFLEAIL